MKLQNPSCYSILRSRILAFLQIMRAGWCFLLQLFAVIEKIRQPSCGILYLLKSLGLLEGQLFIW